MASRRPTSRSTRFPILFPEAGAGEILVDGWAFAPCLLRPTSAGFVKLRSRIPSAKPRILHNYLVSQEDRATMVKAIRRCLEIAGQPALDAVSTGAYGGPEDDSDGAITAFIERNTTTLYHPVGTCAMGRVVDSELRVLGLDEPARGRRLGDADPGPRQHQCADDHDRRAGG